MHSEDHSEVVVDYYYYYRSDYLLQSELLLKGTKYSKSERL